MKRTFFLLLAAHVLLWASLPAAAQKFQPKTIQFKGAPEYSDQELLAATGLKKGALLAFDDMKGYSQKLMDTGLFETLSFKFDGVDLIYNLVPSTALYPVRLENLPLTPGSELDAALHDRFPLYHGKVPTEGGLLDGVRGALEEMLAANGIKATVAAVPYTDPKVRKVPVVSFVITAPPVRVGTIHLEGISSALQAKVSFVASRQIGTSFETGESEKNLEHALELFYADEGYAAVKVDASRSGPPAVTAGAIEIPFSVTVVEGRIYKLGSIHLQSIHLLSSAIVTQADIDKAFGPHTAPAMGQSQSLGAIWYMIASRYKAAGYLDCTVTPHPEFDEASGIVNYTVEVDSGPVYHLAFVKFENVSDELRSRLMRVWQMLPGDPFDAGYVSQFINKAQREDPVLEGSLAGVKVTYDVVADQQTHDVNCVLHFAKVQKAP